MKLRSTERLNNAVKELRQINSQTHALVAKLDNTSFNRAPSKGGWSAGQCLEHLTNSNRLYDRAITRALDNAERDGLRGDAPFKDNLFERLFLWAMEAPPKFKVRAPKIIAKVTPELDMAETTAAYFGTLERISHLIERARGLDLKKIVVPSPFGARGRFNVASALDVGLAHQRRHLLQAERAARF